MTTPSPREERGPRHAYANEAVEVGWEPADRLPDSLDRSGSARMQESEQAAEEVGVASEEKIRNRIEELVGEEHRLWEAESRGEADDDARSRLGELRLTLDQCWDLLRQRRALAESGLDVDAARVRPPETIERYDQ